MTKTTIIAMLFIVAIVSYCVGYRMSQCHILDKWMKAMDKLEISSSNYDFAEGVLWAYDEVMK